MDPLSRIGNQPRFCQRLCWQNPDRGVGWGCVWRSRDGDVAASVRRDHRCSPRLRARRSPACRYCRANRGSPVDISSSDNPRRGMQGAAPRSVEQASDGRFTEPRERDPNSVGVGRFTTDTATVWHW